MPPDTPRPVRSRPAVGTDYGSLGEVPRLRGVVHQCAFAAAFAAGVVLVALAEAGRAQVASWLYASTLILMLGASTLHHRARRASPSVRAWLRRLDHSAIFLFIAGTYTPFALVAFEGTLGAALLGVVWAGAAAGLLLRLFWVEAPGWLAALAYVSLGWVGVVVLPELLSAVGVAVFVLVLVGGGLYTLGALTYVLRRPDPAPAVFGYHEVFHVLVTAAAAVQYIAVSLVVLGAA
jgi:hemolysin III